MPPSKQCIARLQREFRSLQRAPDAGFSAAPTTNDILTWLFVFDGPEGTPYAGGRYVGKIVFPPDYPFKPPDIHIHTPNGRFQTNKPICLTNSAFHPESWSPIWNVSTIITGFISFFVSDEVTTSSMTSTAAHRTALATDSLTFNTKHLGKIYEQTLPEAFQNDCARASHADKDANARRTEESTSASEKAAARETSDAVHAPSKDVAAVPMHSSSWISGSAGFAPVHVILALAAVILVGLVGIAIV